jgi:hypothetical protein
MSKPYVPELIDFLGSLGAGGVAHSGATLLEHFRGTASILERWSCADDVIKAGLFHSVYGTEIFKEAILTLDDRAKVALRIGAYAERLAWIFGGINRSQVYDAFERGPPFTLKLPRYDAEVELAEKELRELVALIWANELEQEQRAAGSAPGTRRSFSRARKLLPEIAIQELAQIYGTRPGVAGLFDLPDASSFVKGFWPDRSFVGEGPRQRLEDFLYDDIRQLLALDVTYVRAFPRVDTKSGPKQITPIMITREQIMPLYDAGFTIYFHSLSSPKFTPWTEALDRELGLAPGATRVSAFASRHGPGVPTHFDPNDNFVIQSKGTKRWRIAPNEHVKYPTTGLVLGGDESETAEPEPPNQFPTRLPAKHEVIDLQPGMVMFVPRGYWHKCETTEHESLHFNIQTGLARWKDLASFILQKRIPINDESMRAGISNLFEKGVLKPELRKELLARIRALVGELTDDDLRISQSDFKAFMMRARGTVEDAPR